MSSAAILRKTVQPQSQQCDKGTLSQMPPTLVVAPTQPTRRPLSPQVGTLPQMPPTLVVAPTQPTQWSFSPQAGTLPLVVAPIQPIQWPFSPQVGTLPQMPPTLVVAPTQPTQWPFSPHVGTLPQIPPTLVVTPTQPAQLPLVGTLPQTPTFEHMADTIPHTLYPEAPQILPSAVSQTRPPQSDIVSRTLHHETSMVSHSLVPQGHDRNQRCRTLKEKCPGNEFKLSVYNCLDSVFTYPRQCQLRTLSIESFKVTEEEKTSQKYWQEKLFQYNLLRFWGKDQEPIFCPLSKHSYQHAQILKCPRKSQILLTWMLRICEQILLIHWSQFFITLKVYSRCIPGWHKASVASCCRRWQNLRHSSEHKAEIFQRHAVALTTAK